MPNLRDAAGICGNCRGNVGTWKIWSSSDMREEARARARIVRVVRKEAQFLAGEGDDVPTILPPLAI
jgi:hypothetical protein